MIDKILTQIRIQYRKYFKKGIKRPSPKDYNKKITSEQGGNDLIQSMLQSGKPLMISRLGSTELSYLSIHLKNKKKHISTWPQWLLEAEYNGGIFPRSNEIYTAFSELYFESLKKMDILGVWHIQDENIICNLHCPQSELVPLSSLEPYYHGNPWSNVLEGKKVLVVHPFAKSIEKQFTKNREQLFKDSAVLREFNLSTVQSIMSIPGEAIPFDSWFEVLHYLQDEINKCDYDIAIIGAGPYGLPLAAYVKDSGKQAIHLGGATQILFGIKGKRWDNHPIISKLYNEHWVRPMESEVPKKANDVEGGCYW